MSRSSISPPPIPAPAIPALPTLRSLQELTADDVAAVEHFAAMVSNPELTDDQILLELQSLDGVRLSKILTWDDAPCTNADLSDELRSLQKIFKDWVIQYYKPELHKQFLEHPSAPALEKACTPGASVYLITPMLYCTYVAAYLQRMAVQCDYAETQKIVTAGQRAGLDLRQYHLDTMGEPASVMSFSG